jgi:hypothetical protein
MSLVTVPHRQTKTRCSILANLGCGSARTNDVGRPQVSQFGGRGVLLRMGDTGAPTRDDPFRSMEIKNL